MIIPSITELHYMLMMYSPRPEIKGAVEVVARASDYLVQQAQLIMRRNEAMAHMVQLYQLGVIPFEGIVEVARDFLKTLKYDNNKIIPSNEEMMMQQVQAMLARGQSANAGMEMQGQPVELGPDGNPLAGQDHRIFNSN